MIDIHLHLDGSLAKEDFLYLSRKDNIDLGKDFPNNITVPEGKFSLPILLELFDLPVSLLQSEANIEYATYSLVSRLAKKGYIYIEVRFAPQLHTLKGCTQLSITQAAIRGLNKALKDYPSIDANLILCTMRHASEEVNMETIEVAHLLRDMKVVGIDLAGNECLHPCSYYSRIFDKAREYGLNITIHGGESTQNDEIMMAIDNGAKRIGHGVHLNFDEESIKKVKDHDVCFEVCPTSNLETNALDTYKDVPYLNFKKYGIPLCINSDDMTVCGTDVITEMKHMKETFSLSEDDVYELLNNAITYAFCEEKDKEKIRNKLKEKISQYYQSLFA